LFFRFLQNKSSVFSPILSDNFAGFSLEKGANQCFLAFCKTKQACFLPSCSEILPILASKKEEIIDY